MIKMQSEVRSRRNAGAPRFHYLKYDTTRMAERPFSRVCFRTMALTQLFRPRANYSQFILEVRS